MNLTGAFGGQPGSILLADATPAGALLISRSLKSLALANPLHVLPDSPSVLQYLTGEGPYGNRQQFPIPVLILLDLGLPQLSALRVLQWIRSRRDLRQLPVVALTTSVFDPEVARAYQEGANTFLIKPDDFTGSLGSLRQVLDFWLDGQQPLRQAA